MENRRSFPFNTADLKRIIKIALVEDNAQQDLTTKYLGITNLIGQATIRTKQDGVLCGINIVRQVFLTLDPECRFRNYREDGARIVRGELIARIQGKQKVLLAGERVALNFLQHLSGIATLTSKFVEKADAKVEVTDTRKTLPGLRQLEKYAVYCGGGKNHRFHLGQMILVKDNHLRLIRLNPVPVEEQLRRLRNKSGGRRIIEIEAKNLEEVRWAVASKGDWIMLDNMHYATLRRAMAFIRQEAPYVKIEISGSVNRRNFQRVIRLQPDRISIGSLTHSAPVLDFSLKIV